MVEVGLRTGLRRGELLALKWNDVDFEKRTLRVDEGLTIVAGKIEFSSPKTRDSVRVVPLGRRVLEILREHKRQQRRQIWKVGELWQANDLVFPDETGNPQNPGTVSGRIASTFRKLGLQGSSLHSLRHSYTTHSLELGVNPKLIQANLGHSTPDLILSVYGHVIPEYQKKASDALDDLIGM